MKDWIEKVDFSTGEESVVTKSDINSFYEEAKNVVRPFMSLNENDNKQLLKSINIMSKTIVYKDIGSTNNIVLKHPVVNETIEAYRDGMTVLFLGKHTNTGNTTISVNGLPTRPVYSNGQQLSSGFIEIGIYYQITYNLTYNRFDMYKLDPSTLTGSGVMGDDTQRFQVANGVDTHDAINVNQMNTLLLRTSIADNTTTTATEFVLSAHQIYLLNNLLLDINDTISSNDISLDTLQEIVNYAKANRNTFGSLTISSISGLQTALNGKASSTHNHDSRYTTESAMDSALATKANITGDASQRFKVKMGYSDYNAITYSYFKAKYRPPFWDYYAQFNPAPLTNAPATGQTWLNTDSGEFFMCTDATHNANEWRGTNNTLINPFTDIFKDRSSIGVYELENSVADTGWRNHATSATIVYYTSSSVMFGTRSINFTDNTPSINVNVNSGKIKTISLWYRADTSADDGNDHIIIDTNTSLKLIYNSTYTWMTKVSADTLYVDGVLTNDRPTNNGWHHYCFTVHYDTVTGISFGNEYPSSTSSTLGANGWIDHVRVFDRELTQSEVYVLYNE